MKITTYDGKDERAILTAMITNRVVLGHLAAKIDDTEPFASPIANIVAELVIPYYRRFGKAPRRDIEGLARAKAETIADPHTVSLLDTFLSGLSGEYARLGKEVNAQFIIDLADKYLNEVKLRRVIESAKGDLDAGHLDRAWEKVKAAERIPLRGESLAALFNDKDKVFSVFDTGMEALVEYPGDLGTFFADTLARDSFVAFVAPEKTGKTFWLLDVAFRAFCQRRKTVFFEAGDMSENQIWLRFLCRGAQHPFRSPTGEWPCTIRYPTSIQKPNAVGVPAEVAWEEKAFQSKLNGAIAWAACERLKRNVVKSMKDYFRIGCSPNSTLSVATIAAELESLDRKGFVADVVVIDYADILDHKAGRLEMRDAICRTWELLRQLSQKRHCLVVTATQTNAKSYEQERLLDRRCFSEDKRKNAHVTGMVGLNVNALEKESQLMRLNWVAKREGDFNSQHAIHVVGCLPLANPAVLSTW